MKYKKGDFVKIIDKLHGHDFELGEKVLITKVFEADYRCNNTFYVKDDEVELISLPDDRLDILEAEIKDLKLKVRIQSEWMQLTQQWVENQNKINDLLKGTL
jgi:hypothetical protein